VAQQQMGQLPTVRVTEAKSFLAAMDYAGPICVQGQCGHGHKSYKAYIYLFVLPIVTKAVHLELVSDLFFAAFIKTLHRFIGKRGQCRRLYSDNNTNFRGADREIPALFRQASEFYRGSVVDERDVVQEVRNKIDLHPPLGPAFWGAMGCRQQVEQVPSPPRHRGAGAYKRSPLYAACGRGCLSQLKTITLP